MIGLEGPETLAEEKFMEQELIEGKDQSAQCTFG